MMSMLDMHGRALHFDSLHGKRVALDLNAPAIALSGNRIQRSFELTRWLKQQRSAAVLIVGDLAWGTEQRAIVIAAQVMDWPLVGSVLTLCWPLDYGVYMAVISDAEGQLSVVDGSEQVLSIDDAIEVAACSESLLLVDGGYGTERFLQEGYVVSHEHKLAAAGFESKSRLVEYTRKRIPHALHAVTLMLVLSLGYAAYEFDQQMQKREALSRKVVTVPPRGSPKLREELRVLVGYRQQVEVLQIYGLTKMIYQPKGARVTLTGQYTVSDTARLREFADVIGADLAVLDTNWQMVFDAQIPSIQSRDLHALESYVAAILSALTTKPGWRVVIEKYVDGGAPISLQGGFRLLSRDYTEANVAAIVEKDPRPLAALLGVIERMPGGVNGQLGDVMLEFNQGRLTQARLSFVVRGEKVAA